MLTAINNLNNIESVTTDETLVKKFNCVECSIQVKDVKLLKLHFWQVHIAKNEIFNHMKPSDSYLFKETLQKKVPSKLKRKYKVVSGTETTKKRKQNSVHESISKKSNQRLSIGNSMDDSTDSLDATLNDIDDINISLDSLNDPQRLLKKVQMLTKDEIKCFHFGQEIDENRFLEHYENKKDSASSNNMKELKNGEIVWAKWKSVGYWPARIEKVVRSKNNQIQKINIRYFEINHMKSHVFKMDPSKIELFYHNVENHVKYKENQAKNKKMCFEFFWAYTDALEEFSNQFEIEVSNAGANATNGKLKFKKTYICEDEQDKYLINDVFMSKKDVTKLAEAPLTEKQLEINREREEASKSLFDILDTNECKDFIISILTSSVDCDRHKNYIEGTVAERKEMKFSSPGPLIVEHQKQLAECLIELQKTHFSDKPAHLKNYEYDVLYPEAVIWGLQKLHKITAKKATTDYENGFQLTQEEINKKRCNEILVKLNQDEADKETTRLDEDFIGDESINFSSVADHDISNTCDFPDEKVNDDVKTALDDIITTALHE